MAPSIWRLELQSRCSRRARAERRIRCDGRSGAIGSSACITVASHASSTTASSARRCASKRGVRRAVARQPSGGVGHAGAAPRSFCTQSASRWRDILDDIRTDAGRPVLLPRRRDRLRRRRRRHRRRPVIVRHHDDSSALDQSRCRGAGSANGPCAAGRDAWRGRWCGRFGGDSSARTSRAASRFRSDGAVSRRTARPIEAVDDRSLCMIDRLGGMQSMAIAARRLSITSKAAHASLDRGHALPKVRASTLNAMPEESLMLAITPPVESTTLRRTIKRAAKRSDGLPARFAELLWGAAELRRPWPASRAPADRRGAAAVLWRRLRESSVGRPGRRAESGRRPPTWPSCASG